MTPLALLWSFACIDLDDYDRDGFVEPADCDDNAPAIHPGASEIPYDGIDQDCSGADLTDQDGDGFDAIEAGGQDCNDYKARIRPGAEEIPYDDVDQDCDGWSDDDFDHDGFLAKGHGGDDCDDFDARITPVDLDFDGHNPCTGDCDESDPLRHEDAPPICGNGVDDDCDQVSDCAPTGLQSLADLTDRVVAGRSWSDFGWRIATPGDLDGDQLGDLVITGVAEDGHGAAFVMAGPLGGELPANAARARIELAGLAVPVPAGDIDGDGRAELWLGEIGAVSSVWLLSVPDAGVFAPEAVARLQITAPGGGELGEAITPIDRRVAVGSSSAAGGRGETFLISDDTTGEVPFGDGGLVLTGQPMDYSGTALHGVDLDGDGAQELLIGAPGSLNGFRSGVYRVADLPTSGARSLQDADSFIDARPWGWAGSVLESGDLDGDGRVDLAVGAPLYESRVGGVAVFLDGVAGDVAIDEAPAQLFGLGDDTFGGAIAIDDLDGDGQDDLAIGAPASWAAGGGSYKPGAVHLWYGPIDRGNSLSFTADLFLDGLYSGARTFSGYSLAMGDLDGDGGMDLAIGSPRQDAGQVDLLWGGQTLLQGL